MVDLLRSTNANNLRHLEVENGDADERGYDCCVNLCPEGVHGRNVHIMCQLEILREIQRMGGRNVTIGLLTSIRT